MTGRPAPTVYAALQDARSLAIRVMDKNIGPLSDQAREVLGTLNAALGDLPTAEEAQAAMKSQT